MERPSVPDRLSGTTAGSGAEVVVRRRRTGRWIGAVVVALIVVWIVYQLIVNKGFEWSVVGRYFLSGEILNGLLLTVELTIVAEAVGIAIGIVVAVLRMTGNPVTELAAAAYIWFFRGTPALVQLVFWYNLASLFPTFALGIPFGGPKVWDISANAVISPFTAAILGLGLNEGAYMAEIVRGGILSVDAGQMEASRALGMRPLLTMRRIVLPQAMRSIIPATGNQTIGMLKYTSLASVVSLQELLNSAETIYTRTFQTIPLLIVASLWYLVLTTVLSYGQFYLERYFARGSSRQLPATPWARIVQGLRGARGWAGSEAR